MLTRTQYGLTISALSLVATLGFSSFAFAEEAPQPHHPAEPVNCYELPQLPHNGQWTMELQHDPTGSKNFQQFYGIQLHDLACEIADRHGYWGNEYNLALSVNGEKTLIWYSDQVDSGVIRSVMNDLYEANAPQPEPEPEPEPEPVSQPEPTPAPEPEPEPEPEPTPQPEPVQEEEEEQIAEASPEPEPAPAPEEETEPVVVEEPTAEVVEESPEPTTLSLTSTRFQELEPAAEEEAPEEETGFLATLRNLATAVTAFFSSLFDGGE